MKSCINAVWNMFKSLGKSMKSVMTFGGMFTRLFNSAEVRGEIRLHLVIIFTDKTQPEQAKALAALCRDIGKIDTWYGVHPVGKERLLQMTRVNSPPWLNMVKTSVIHQLRNHAKSCLDDFLATLPMQSIQPVLKKFFDKREHLKHIWPQGAKKAPTVSELVKLLASFHPDVDAETLAYDVKSIVAGQKQSEEALFPTHADTCCKVAELHPCTHGMTNRRCFS